MTIFGSFVVNDGPSRRCSAAAVKGSSESDERAACGEVGDRGNDVALLTPLGEDVEGVCTVLMAGGGGCLREPLSRGVEGTGVGAPGVVSISFNLMRVSFKAFTHDVQSLGLFACI